VPVAVRGDGSLSDLLRVVLAATRAGAPITVSCDVPLPDGVIEHLVETPEAFLARAREHPPERVRVIGTSATAVAKAVNGNPDVAIYGGAVTQSGRIELLPFLREQAISITNHRFGNRDRAFDAVLPRS
jgi:RHH-type proline utilization regulon transcriptional repressor/proline dehydrogenase/delta 1-pyrroline-5-carboxylate dehydrogenase